MVIQNQTYSISRFIGKSTEYLVNQLLIVVGILLIWQEAVAVIYCTYDETIMALYKFGGQENNRQINITTT